MKVVSFQQIADSLGISKQAVDKLFVKKGYLQKNNKGKIDIENPYNFEFLQSKGADFSCFGVSAPPKKEIVPLNVRPKPKEKPLKEKDLPSNFPPDEENILTRLEKQYKIENIKAKEKIQS